jgi:hemoglobin
MFGQWLDLFDATCTDLFPPTTAAAFCDRAHRIAQSLQMGLFERLPVIRQVPAGGTGHV